ncbi:polysaccharide pyruvyl transferase family protein [Nocardia sp. CDC153]|uniref:polysaccharide pyruvyl transferase family protein n=1 Tax=Nocardia sp. CDC153 TaxID=3112167 RepID=UPI002DBAFFBC|nr:polysaccharide pyruvyl transferase family protein [Nocardia sp. CDC153]MEC3955829.1 polysaccharide pyruvyl transferase family protein [Nocardia sp. CDC153]
MGNSGAGVSAGTFKILVENGEYRLHNRGDIAMMAITVERLRERWPRARIGMLTDEPRVLRGLLPQVEPVVSRTGGHWGRSGLAGMMDEQAGVHLIGPAALQWRAMTDMPKRHLRDATDRARREVHRLTLRDLRPAPTGLDLPPVPAALAASDLVVALGGSYLTDVDPRQAHRTLNLLEAAQHHGIPNVMTGQGLGPIHDPELRRRAAEVLPDVDLIAVREGRYGPALLAELGVPADRILVTGDDAVEFAYRVRRSAIGADLGVCLRISKKSKVSDAARDTLTTVLRREAGDLDVALAPLIVSEHEDEDRRHTLPLLADATRTRPALARTGTAQDLVRQVARCRVVVTSAYHLALFALSQGIPAVAVTASRYYDDKFHGLADAFDSATADAGLRIVHLDVDNLDAELTRAVRQLWESAPEVRDTLQQRAVEQIDAGRAGLDRVAGLVAGGEAGPVTVAEPRQGD